VQQEQLLADLTAANEELVAKLQNEIALEEDMKEEADLTTNIKEYLENSPFEVRWPPHCS
jgi:complement component 1 Q subcomponent-binding protein, mitochondrial